MSGGGEAAADCVDAQTSVWWDIENCQVPRICDAFAIARNINSALSNMNYRGSVTISAYGDTTRIPLAVQQSLSSTGVSLHHVPAGAKDASDKKILVDMLFWAIDHKAPANYLLISGDRDFANALHKLKMRKYNILVAHPRKPSPALVSAAKSVWFWTDLVKGGAPISENQLKPEAMQDCSSEPTHVHQSERLIPPPVKVGTGDPEYKRVYVKKNLNQPNVAKAPDVQTRVQDNSHQPDNAQTRVCKKAPHEFFRPNGQSTSTNWSVVPNNLPVNPDPSATNVKESVAGKQEDQSPSHTRPRFTPMRFNSVPGKVIKANPAFHSIPAFKPHSPPLPSSASPASSLDIANLTLSHYPNDDQRPLNLAKQTGEVSKLNSVVENSNPESTSSLASNPDIKTNVPPYHNPSIRPPHEISSGSLFQPTHASASSNSGIYEVGGLAPPPSDDELELMGLLLDALNRLKKENISPTAANIADCIRFGDLKNRNTDVTKALDVALERKMVVKHAYGGGLEMYVALGQKIWSCINPKGGNPNEYEKPIWDSIEQFLISPGGHTAIVASSCKYEAALNLKKLCLQNFTLGHVIRILNILAGPKRWIKHNQSGWQPVITTLNRAHVEASPVEVSR